MDAARGTSKRVGWVPVVGAMAVGAALMGIVFWRWNLDAVDEAVRAKRAALKKLSISGNIPPNEEVVKYLTARQRAFERHYEHWANLVTSAPVAEAATANPQLYFQQAFHEVQRTLERLVTARGLPMPEQLGFPKELPPSDTVPRLLIQLALIDELAPLMLEQGVAALTSFKVEDPETVMEEDGKAPFLARLPVRARFTSSLPQLMKMLGAIGRVRPSIEIRGIRVANAASPEQLDVELLLARHLLLATPAAEPVEEKPTRARGK